MALLGSLAALAVAGCAPAPKQAQHTSEIGCKPSGDTALVGNWLGQRTQPGVAGSFQVWMHLQPNGTMTYAERLQRKGKPPQSLRETGCWQRDADTNQLVLRTLKSNGAWVEANDPIYVNRYPFTVPGAGQLQLGKGQSAFSLKRMPNDYRLPF
ncbi:MAG: hypothetical protein CML17_10525 [Pusillimonas sp.]|nr:hypothetical protein [Pusillimonas sp.]